MQQTLFDFGTPTSHLSENGNSIFLTAAADDFIIATTDPQFLNFRITKVKTTIVFRSSDIDSPAATPKTALDGVFVVLYEDNSGQPKGVPTIESLVSYAPEINSAGFGPRPTNTYDIAYIPISDLISEEKLDTEVEQLYPWDILLPIGEQNNSPTSNIFVIQPNVRYWISVMPRFPFEPPGGFPFSSDDENSGKLSTSWGFSTNQFGHLAKAGSNLEPTDEQPCFVPFWTDTDGSQGSGDGSGCASGQTGEFGHLAIEIYGRHRRTEE